MASLVCVIFWGGGLSGVAIVSGEPGAAGGGQWADQLYETSSTR
jgi:hypothetical protein